MKSFITILLATISVVACGSTFHLDSKFEAYENASELTILERADLNHDSWLDAGDLLIVLAAVGSREGEADINEDQIVDESDAFLILHLYTTQCEGF